MAGITFTRDNIFKGWVEGESSRIVGVVGEEYEHLKEEPRVEQLRKWITQYHTSDAQEPYFYSVRKVCLLRESQLSRNRVQFILTILTCISVSVIIFLKTRSYFENAWKVCQAIADKKEYVLKHPFRLYGFDRYATAQDIWEKHPTAGAPFLLFFRNAFCFLFPFGGMFGWAALNGWATLNKETDERRYYNLIIDRSKDERVCPKNFDIQNEVDPLTQDKISIEKLHSPQMIYLPNYVTEAKSFVTALLIAGKKDFSDPLYRREFTDDERKNILSQIERIFLISEEKFNKYLEEESNTESLLDLFEPYRFLIDERVFDQAGQFSEEAEHSLRGVLGDDVGPLNFEIEEIADQMPSEEQREWAGRILRMYALETTDYIDSLKKDDKADWRICLFKMETGLSLRSPDV